MVLSLSRQYRIFLSLQILIAIVFLLRIAALSPLYTNPDLRLQAEEVIRKISDEQGWILSDLEIHRIDAQSVTILHRSHVRGVDPIECVMIDLSTSTKQPCVK